MMQRISSEEDSVAESKGHAAEAHGRPRFQENGLNQSGDGHKETSVEDPIHLPYAVA